MFQVETPENLGQQAGSSRGDCTQKRSVVRQELLEQIPFYSF